MKFIFADSLDVVDPNYDFASDSFAPGRKAYWGDRYPHEMMNPAPYDGVLVSRGIVGDHRFPGKYSSAQSMRFRRVGARQFLRLEAPRFASMPIFGDSGAFSYVQEEKPPYTPTELLEFYADAGFTHGCSLDHIIFDFDRETHGLVAGSDHARRRFDITLENAREFLSLARDLGPSFSPIGVAQGWSPSSVAESAARLEKMGYTYIAIGGLVPLRAEDVHRCLHAVRGRLSWDTRIHLLGFAKAEQIDDFARYAPTSFDSTSPLIRAFKDSKSNYYVETETGLEYYAAVRIPQAIENPRFMRAVKVGSLDSDTLLRLERHALESVRGYDRGTVQLDTAVESVCEYGSLLADDPSAGSRSRLKLAAEIRIATARTLKDRPWARCPCEICKQVSVEVVIFRSSNRNKRRGFHNLGVFFEHVQRLLGKEIARDSFQIPRRAGAAEC
jgi:hypothetical protein